MLELPEVLRLTKELNESVGNREIEDVFPPTKVNKFCWFNGDPKEYAKILRGSKIVQANGKGIFVDLVFDNGHKLSINDGVNVRLVNSIPNDYQLTITFKDGGALVFSVIMYGGIFLHDGTYDNEYYVKSQNFVSPFSNDFKNYFYDILNASRQTLSAKAFIATEQRFPGIGNGVSQDILFDCKLHPKRKISSLSIEEKEKLYESIVGVLKEMTDKGGRDTEKNLYGEPGMYEAKMSKKMGLCPRCKNEIVKGTYLGGSVYYCPCCQRITR